MPLNTITLADVLALPPSQRDDVGALPLDSIDMSPTALDSIPIAGLALGATPLDSIPLNPAPPNTESANAAEWCAAIDALDGFACPGPGQPGERVIDPSTETVVGATVRGVALDSIALDSIPLDSIALDSIPLDSIALDSIPLDSIPLDSIEVRDTPLDSIPLDSIFVQHTQPIALDSIPLDSIGPGIVTPTCGATTLGAAHVASCLLPGVTLADLVVALKAVSGDAPVTLADLFETPTVVVGSETVRLTLHDLFTLLLGETAFDWSQLDLATFPLADFATEGGEVQYNAEFTVTGGPTATRQVTIQATLPEGGRYIQGSSQLILGESGSSLTPQIGPGALTWQTTVDVGETYTLRWRVRPGLVLGSYAATASIAVNGLASAVLSGPAAISVEQTFDANLGTPGDTNNDPDTAPILDGSTLYVSHLEPGDVDYYRIPVGSHSSRVEVTLSHIPEGLDYDLAVSGPHAPRLRTQPGGSAPLTNTQLQDTGSALDQPAQALPPEGLRDLPLDAMTVGGNVLRGISDNRGDADEHLKLISQGETGFYVVQVSNFGGGGSSKPYVLEVEQFGPPDLGICSPRGGMSNGAPGAAPTLGAATNTLFLVNESRLISTHGAAATATLMSKLNALAGRTDLGINGAVVRVERGPASPAHTGAWDANPCSPELANDVVEQIGAYLDQLETSAPNVAYKVMVGGDDMIPFARTPDETEVANEATYRDALGTTNNQYRGSLGAGFLLTDDVYTEEAAPSFLGRELFVPEQSGGRLVETPAEISRTIDDFVASGGAVAPTSSLVTGYDFLTDGAQQVQAQFAQRFGTQARSLINDTWDDAAFLAQLFPTTGSVPRLTSLNAHFDHNRLLPAAEDAAQRANNLVDTADITSRGINAMAGRLPFSVGCHAGLAVSNAVFGAGNLLGEDWAQAMLGTGAIGWIGNTGFGLGDTVVVGYTEQLHALLAPKLDGTMTIGQALAQAKQEYLANLGIIGPYDAKVMQQTTLYGLPMTRLGTGTPPAPPAPLPLVTDAATGLPSADFDVSPTFTNVNTTHGRYYRADGGVQLTQRRPIEPLVSLEVTQPGGLLAHGALIRLLTSPADELNFNAAYSRVTTDLAANEPELVGETAFPTKIQHISTFSGLTGLRQKLNLIVGLFRSDGVIEEEGIGTHRRYSRVAGKILYSASTTDWRAPQLGQLQALTVSPGVAGFTVDVADKLDGGGPGVVKAVVLLYRDCSGVWRTVDLVNAVGDRYTASGLVTPSSCIEIDYYLQAADAAGNVGVASRKIQLQPLVLPPDVVPDGASAITSSLSGTQAPNGWYRSAVTVTLSLVPASDDEISYLLDGDPYTYTGPFVVSGDGVHIIQATTDKGAEHTTGFVIDATGPETAITRTPATPDGANGWYVASVKLRVSASDLGGSNVAAIRCVLNPATPPATFSNIPAGCAYLGAGAFVTVQGINRLYAASIDDAGNVSPVEMNEWKFDQQAPVPSMGPQAAFQTLPSFPVSWSATDNASGPRSYDVRYRTASSNSSSFGSFTTWQTQTTALNATFTATPGLTYCFSSRARDFAFNTSGWSSEVCTTAPLDDASLTRAGTWTTINAADLYAGRASRTSTVGSSLSVSLTGRVIGVVVTKLPGGGTIQLRWNGSTRVTSSLAAATRQPGPADHVHAPGRFIGDAPDLRVRQRHRRDRRRRRAQAVDQAAAARRPPPDSPTAASRTGPGSCGPTACRAGRPRSWTGTSCRR